MDTWDIDRKKAIALTRCLDVLCQYDEIIPARYAMIFLEVGLHHKTGGVTATELEETHGWSYSTITRALRSLAGLTGLNRKRKAVIDLLPDPREHRSKKAVLTKDGITILQAALSHLS